MIGKNQGGKKHNRWSGAASGDLSTEAAS
jgi:hypothetical protein